MFEESHAVRVTRRVEQANVLRESVRVHVHVHAVVLVHDSEAVLTQLKRVLP